MQEKSKKSLKPAQAAGTTVVDLTNGGMSVAQAVVEDVSEVEAGIMGGVGAVTSAVGLGWYIHELVKGSATLKNVNDAYEAIKAARAMPKVGRLTEAEKEALDRALEAIPPLVEKIKERHVGVNSSKLGGRGLSVVGSGLTIAGVFFPPALIAGLALSVVGTTVNFVASLIELSFKHRWKFAEIMAKLGKEGGLWVLPLGANQEVDQAEQPNTDDATCEQESKINARVRPKDKARLLTSKILTALGPVLSVGFERPRDPPPTYADVIEEDRRKMDK